MSSLSRIRLNILALFFLGVSLIGLFLVAVLTFSAPPSEVISSRQRITVGSIFGVICLLGIVAGVFPSRCSRMLHFQERGGSRPASQAKQKIVRKKDFTFEGHHPGCEDFSAHVFRLGGEKYCAGCTGLVAGAVISLLGTLVFFSTEIVLGDVGALVFWFGFVGVVLGLLQHPLSRKRGAGVHVLLNVAFVLGAFLLLIGIDGIASNMFLESYFLALVFYWILTRILLSQQEHGRICRACGLESCLYFEKRGLTPASLGDPIDGA